MDPVGWVFGLALGALLGGLVLFVLPLIGWAALMFLLVNPRTRRAGLLAAVAAGASILIGQYWLSWHPALSLYDRAFTLLGYFLDALLPWSFVMYLTQKMIVRKP
jgi:hypothetical protein